MMSNYIKIKATEKNEFRTTMSIVFNGQEYGNINVKIDTGCPRTTILTSKLGISDSVAKRLKENDITNRVEASVSFGVNDSEEYKSKMKAAFRKGELSEIDSVSFKKPVQNINICGVNIGSREVRINYNRIGNILIGVDILKDWDIHIGTTRNGDTIFLACPKEQINEAYMLELAALVKESTGLMSVF